MFSLYYRQKPSRPLNYPHASRIAVKEMCWESAKKFSEGLEGRGVNRRTNMSLSDAELTVFKARLFARGVKRND